MLHAARFGALVGLAALAALAPPAQPANMSTRALVDAAAGYVAQYEQQLTSVVADELYTQDIVDRSPPDPDAPRRRRLRSEVFFLFSPGEGDWMAIRDVLMVDGSAVTDRPNIGEALQRLPAREVAATFKTYNSRYNIGRTYRNFNEPTLSLLVLDERHRGRLSFSKGEDRGAVVTVAFTEKDRPPLIMDPTRGAVFSTGELLIEPATGRVRRAVLRARVQNLSVELTTVYAPDDRLDMWLPSVFREVYEYGKPPSSSNATSARPEFELVVCEARYSNFRRFETQVRIK
jgi:hypothetical protein